MSRMIYHPDTGTFMALDDCVVVDVPETVAEADAIEEYLEATQADGKVTVEVDLRILTSATPLRVLVACEFSGTVRDAFLAAGHDAWSCDILPAERPSNRHIRGDVRDVLAKGGWDLLMVAHPPCTRLCNSGVRWLSKAPPGRTLTEMWLELNDGAKLFSDLWNADVPRICVENPVMHRYAKDRIINYVEPAQSVQPWQFGHGECKRTCFWLKNLPPLVPTNVVDGRDQRVHMASPGPDRWKERSRFYPGIAKAMAEQWGGVIADDYPQAA